MPVRSGPIFVSFAGVHVALRALILKDDLARRGVSLLLGQVLELIEHFLPVGIRQAAAGREQPTRAVGNASRRVAGQGLLLIEREIGELDTCRSRSLREATPSSRCALAARAARRDGPRV